MKPHSQRGLIQTFCIQTTVQNNIYFCTPEPYANNLLDNYIELSTLTFTPPPFPSYLREKWDAAWIIHTAGMPGPVSVSHTTSLIHYSLICFFCSWKKCSVSVVTLLLCSAATYFLTPAWILCFAICSDYRLSKSMIAYITYTYMYYLCNIAWAGYLHFILHSVCTANRFSLCLHSDCSLTFV